MMTKKFVIIMQFIGEDKRILFVFFIVFSPFNW